MVVNVEPLHKYSSWRRDVCNGESLVFWGISYPAELHVGVTGCGPKAPSHSVAFVAIAPPSQLRPFWIQIASQTATDGSPRS